MTMLEDLYACSVTSYKKCAEGLTVIKVCKMDVRKKRGLPKD